ncbi:4Fe-4S dicluster domain-containing protein [Stetteria hydrogenophila]
MAEAKGKRVAMVIDMNSCVGCMACVVACVRENVARQKSDGVVMPEPERVVALARTKPVTLGLESGVPEDTPAFIQCQHCEDAPCALVCPTGATYIDDYGVVRLDHSKCIGCKSCIMACPYGARTMHRGELEGEPPNPYGFIPGYPDKCTFCIHRAEESIGAWTPACVEACAFGARLFGFMDEEPIKSIIESGKAVRLLAHCRTEPKIFYVLPNKGR